jgi:thiol-disulfide isomerase/thioredoxin
MRTRLNALVIAALLATWAPLPQAQAIPPGPCPITGPPNLNLTMKNLNGKDVSLSSYKGKVLLINYWATWCVPCKIEIPGFIDLYNRYRKQGLEVVGIDVNETAATAKPYASAIKMNYPVLLADERDEVLEAFGHLEGVPMTVIINREATTCERHVGLTRKSTFEEAIKRLL